MNDPKIIIALDFAAAEPALQLVARLDPVYCRLKVGKELFTAEGPRLVEQLVHRGFGVFLDLKFHDIPSTTAKACEAAAGLGVWMLNVHASGGRSMLLAAREAIDKSAAAPLLIAVTVLTSMDEPSLHEVGVVDGLQRQVLRLATLAQDCALDGIVCSAQEAPALRQALGQDFCLVTPGIRPTATSRDDQARVVTPADARRMGSSYLVIGRPITQAPDPLAALIAIHQEISDI
ncbi:orotidine 5'-phosphate decarboxylase [mine drainage metagenome]|uniref:Orotidine 5'-phosphate decarboxylase n=1 Tax=mine drainage metagenome TaxID=410659 RepID=A0A1J5QFX0_9ZZZZ